MSGFIPKKLAAVKTLGEKLRDHRRQKNLSPEKTARILNINRAYIENLEKDNYLALPPDVYTINILKGYAELLNLNPTTVIALFQKEKNLFLKTRKTSLSQKMNRFYRILNRILNPKTLKSVAIIVILLAILGYIGWGIRKIISPPELIIDQPADNLIITENHVTIKGKTEKEVSLTINNRALLSNQAGEFSLVLDLQKGLNVIKISAQKKHSREQTLYRKIMVLDAIEASPN